MEACLVNKALGESYRGREILCADKHTALDYHQLREFLLHINIHDNSDFCRNTIYVVESCDEIDVYDIPEYMSTFEHQHQRGRHFLLDKVWLRLQKKGSR
jgi:hypothetical protein